jgi:cytochrome b involved in lipid metabolism
VVINSVLAAAAPSDNPFFLVTGLPVHTLVVHFAVSMIPLSAVALIAVILVPRWRGAFVWAALVGLVIGTGAAFISKQSGEALAEVVGVPSVHSKWGDVLPWVAVFLLVLAVVWYWLARKAPKQDPMPRISLGSGAQMLVGIVAILVGLFAFGLTVVVGHTGAGAVWESRSLDTETVEDTSGTGGSTGATASGYTLADIQAHSTPADCWSLVNGQAYDLTKWIPQHPGGPGVVEGMCGKDGSSAYNGKHKGSASAAAALSGFLLPPLGGATAAPSASATAAPASSAAASGAGGYTLADVQTHATPTDCWSVVNGNVYDLTQWIPQHPGGPAVIEGMCGIDGTAAYEGKHKGSASAGAALSAFLLAPVGGSPASPAAAASGGAGLTMAAVKTHATPTDCWSVVNGNVYDLTQWIPQHPGGPAVIEGMCGIDGTASYDSQHKGNGEADAALSAFVMGPLG